MPTMRNDPFHSDFIPNCRTLRESECRGAATYLCNPLSPWVIHPCNVEVCRIRQVCCGPMKDSEFSKDNVFGMVGGGLGDYQFTELPACATDGNANFRECFEAMRKRFRQALEEEPDQHWEVVAEIMKILRWNKPEWLRAQFRSVQKTANAVYTQPKIAL